MRKLSSFLWLLMLFSSTIIAQENKVAVKKSGDSYMLEANGKYSLNNTAFTKSIV